MPTTRELDFADMEVEGFPGLFGWNGMPLPLREEIAAHVRATITEPAAVERFAALGLAPRPPTPAGFEADLKRVGAVYAEAARRFGAQPAD